MEAEQQQSPVQREYLYLLLVLIHKLLAEQQHGLAAHGARVCWHADAGTHPSQRANVLAIAAQHTHQHKLNKRIQIIKILTRLLGRFARHRGAV
jgi:hypothetical protein